MIVRTEVKEQPNGDILKFEYDENGLLINMTTQIKGGGRIRCIIANPERLEAVLDNTRRHFMNKMKMQSDEAMKVYEDYTQRKLTNLAAKKKQSV